MTFETKPQYWEKQSLFPLEGGCVCGQVRYRLEAPPIVVHCCHCTMCQRETGTAFALNAVVESSKVTHLAPARATVPPCPLRPDESKAAGPPLAPVGAAGADGVVVEPRLTKMPSESGFGQPMARCPTCGVAVWSNYAGAGPVFRFIRVGTLDRAWEITPDVHIYTSSKRDFITINDGKPQFAGFYPKKAELYRKDSLDRYAKVEAEIRKFAERRNKKGPSL